MKIGQTEAKASIQKSGRNPHCLKKPDYDGYIYVFELLISGVLKQFLEKADKVTEGVMKSQSLSR